MRFISLIGACALIPALLVAAPVQLATRYDGEDVTDYLVSEKLDGIRAIWDGHQLTTRKGHRIHTPQGYTKDWPTVWLDGELWAGRQQFSKVQHTVLDQTPNAKAWQEVHYYVFDAPSSGRTFAQRARYYQSNLEALSLPHLKAIEQREIPSNQALYEWLNDVVGQGGEGLVLHRKDAEFKDGRSNALLKLKPYMDSEAIVVGYTQGKGKYQGLVGALVVKLKNGTRFRLGSGLSDAQRANPPKVGEVVTFTYQGFTQNGIPRFASFLRVREDDFDW